jgi:hypothetical protein
MGIFPVPGMTRLSALGALWLLGCASTAKGPVMMNAASHSTAAKGEAEIAAAHDTEVGRGERASRRWCGRPLDAIGFCWTSLVSADSEHRRAAESHREAAATHRGRSSALRAAEASACAGIAESERDQSPFSHREDIVRVDVDERAGVTVVFRAVEGMTAAGLQRVIDCHLARNAALGHEVPEMSYCPLAPAGVLAEVRPVAGGFAVDVTTRDPAASALVYERALALRPREGER